MKILPILFAFVSIWNFAIAQDDNTTVAVAVLSPVGSNTTSGVVKFISTPEGTEILADITGLTPGKHGFHIYDGTSCSDTGNIFNPFHVKHAGPNDPIREIGDLGNLEADESGNAHYDRIDKFIRLDGPLSVVGKFVVVHAKEDDLKTQPNGNSGPHVACGVIIEQ